MQPLNAPGRRILRVYNDETPSEMAPLAETTPSETLDATELIVLLRAVKDGG